MMKLTSSSLNRTLSADARRSLARTVPCMPDGSAIPDTVRGEHIVMEGVLGDEYVCLVANRSGITCRLGRGAVVPPHSDTFVLPRSNVTASPISVLRVAIVDHVAGHAPVNALYASLVSDMLLFTETHDVNLEYARDLAVAVRKAYTDDSAVNDAALVAAINSFDVNIDEMTASSALTDRGVTALAQWFASLDSLSCSNLVHVGPCGFRAGVTAVVGGTDKGKSPAALAIARMLDGDGSNRAAGYSPISEPFPGCLGHERFASEVIDYINSYLTSDNTTGVNEVHLCDSPKDVIVMLKGAAWKAGYTRTTIPMLTTLSRLYATVGCLMVMPINTAGLDDSDVQGLIGQSVGCLVSCVEAWNGTTSKWTAVQRTAPSAPRISFDVTIGSSPDRQAVIVDARFSDGSSTDQRSIVAATYGAHDVSSNHDYSAETALAAYVNGFNI